MADEITGLSAHFHYPIHDYLLNARHLLAMLCAGHLQGKVMDTIEELGGTYFYGGLRNLSAQELFFG